MREMVLNHASLASCQPAEAVPWLVDVVCGLRTLVGNRVVGKSLRMAPPEPGALSLPGAYEHLRKHGERESRQYLLELSTKSPLLHGVDEETKGRFLACEALGCEAEKLPSEAGAPLVFCALNDAISVGVPSEPLWDRDRLTVHFQTLLPDESFDERREGIDNLARAAHADRILECHRRSARQHCASGAELWEQRRELFPNLLFGPEVEDHLDGINVLDKVMRRLAELDESAASWSSGPAPEWLCDVRNESSTVRNTPKLLEKRRFTSVTGGRELFALHASFDKGRRIHLRLDGARRQVEIGYIGEHLPTKRFPK